MTDPTPTAPTTPAPTKGDRYEMNLAAVLALVGIAMAAGALITYALPRLAATVCR
jgi:hypothetical protein